MTTSADTAKEFFSEAKKRCKDDGAEYPKQCTVKWFQAILEEGGREAKDIWAAFAYQRTEGENPIKPPSDSSLPISKGKEGKEGLNTGVSEHRPSRAESPSLPKGGLRKEGKEGKEQRAEKPDFKPSFPSLGVGSKGKEGKKEFSVIWLSDFEPPPLPEPIAHLLGNTGTVAMHCGDGDAGKTTNVVAAASAVTKGVDYCGKPTKQGIVLHVGGEEHLAIFKQRYVMLGADMGKVALFQGGKILDAAKSIMPIVTIIDTVSQFGAMAGYGEEWHNKASAVRRFVAMCRNIAQVTDGVCVLIMHNNSAGKRYGSVDWYNSSDLFFEYQLSAGRFFVEQSRARSERYGGELVLQDNEMTFKEGEASKAQKPVEQRIIERCHEGASKEQLCQSFKNAVGSYKAVSDIIKQLIADGKLRESEGYVYSS